MMLIQYMRIERQSAFENNISKKYWSCVVVFHGRYLKKYASDWDEPNDQNEAEDILYPNITFEWKDVHVNSSFIPLIVSRRC